MGLAGSINVDGNNLAWQISNANISFTLVLKIVIARIM
jgi:hypothetical protein